jgi:hypothetical protein
LPRQHDSRARFERKHLMGIARLLAKGRGVARKAREQVRWTCENDERRELGRAAGLTAPNMDV